MKTILVLAPHPDLPDALRQAFDPEAFRVVHRLGVAEAEPFLHPRLVDICVLDADPGDLQDLRSIEKLRRRLPPCLIIVYTSARQAEWEEEAYLKGASHILIKPFRPRLLLTLLEQSALAAPAAAPPRVPRREAATPAD